jgi:hypothetical protein
MTAIGLQQSNRRKLKADDGISKIENPKGK